MANDVHLYDGHDSHLAADLQSDLRRQTCGEDLGQASWLIDSLTCGSYGSRALLRSKRL